MVYRLAIVFCNKGHLLQLEYSAKEFTITGIQLTKYILKNIFFDTIRDKLETVFSALITLILNSFINFSAIWL